jgi:signal transduction histidine kinase
MFSRGLISLFFSAFLFLHTHAQTGTIDNLKNKIRTAKNDKEKLTALFSLCDQGYTLHPDTLMLLAIKAEHFARQMSDLHEELRAKYYMSYALTNKGLIDSSLSMADQCLKILSRSVNDPVLEGKVLNQKGRCYMRKNQYKEAIDQGHQVIEKGEMANDTLLQMQGKTLIGWAYLEMKQTSISLQWHLKALRTTTDTQFIKKYSILFANIALNYNALGKKDSAFYFINKAIEYSRLHENLFALSNSLAIQAQLLISTGKPGRAEASLKEVIDIRKLIGDPFYIVSDMAQLGLYYAHNGLPEKGITICKEGIDIANKYNIGTKLFFLYTTLADNYKIAGRTKEYSEVLEKLIMLKDSVYRMNSEEALAEIQTKYDLQKKENTIIQQKLDLTKKNYWLYGSLIVMLLAAVATYFIFKNYRKRQQIAMLLMLEKEKTTSRKAVLTAEENERKRIAADLHDNLGAYAASIASNIDQISIPSSDANNVLAMQELRNNSQSIVSQLNDTIWVLKKDALSLTAISDRVKVFIQRIQFSYPSVKIDVIENIETDHLLPPSQAFHLFQILQEAINNAVRHSGGRQINVIMESSKSWKINVSDDGKGMSGALMNKEGNGLLNMKNRSGEAGWLIEWQTNEPHGTRLTIMPTTN